MNSSHLEMEDWLEEDDDLDAEIQTHLANTTDAQRNDRIVRTEEEVEYTIKPSASDSKKRKAAGNQFEHRAKIHVKPERSVSSSSARVKRPLKRASGSKGHSIDRVTETGSSRDEKPFRPAHSRDSPYLTTIERRVEESANTTATVLIQGDRTGIATQNKDRLPATITTTKVHMERKPPRAIETAEVPGKRHHQELGSASETNRRIKNTLGCAFETPRRIEREPEYTRETPVKIKKEPECAPETPRKTEKEQE